MALLKRSTPAEIDVWNRDFPIPSIVRNFQREMNQLFSEFFRGDISEGTAKFGSAWTPAVDIEETNDSYTIKAELPGMKKDEVKITLHDNILTISGEKKSEYEEKKGEYHRIERSYGAFERSFSLPAAIKPDAIDARYDDGVLTLTLPKTEETKPKFIDIKVK